MLELEKTEVVGWGTAIRGMRNPLNSWAKSDTDYSYGKIPFIGNADMKLMQALIKGGSDERKFLRMIVVVADCIAPLYW